MLTLYFAGNALGELSALNVSQDASTARWRATLELSAASQLDVQQAVAALEGKLAGEGALEVREDAVQLRVLSPGMCASGPRLARRNAVESDDALAHPVRTVSLEFEATLQMTIAEATPASRNESISTTMKRHIVELPVLAPNIPAWRQEIGAPSFEVLQEGEARGADYPAPQPPLYATEVFERTVRFTREAECVTRWRYVMHPSTYVPAKAPTP
jgi:hypothetical protein